jgi:hypothetical protein
MSVPVHVKHLFERTLAALGPAAALEAVWDAAQLEMLGHVPPPHHPPHHHPVHISLPDRRARAQLRAQCLPEFTTGETP